MVLIVESDVNQKFLLSLFGYINDISAINVRILHFFRALLEVGKNRMFVRSDVLSISHALFDLSLPPSHVVAVLAAQISALKPCTEGSKGFPSLNRR
jgi:hypothetical protein